MQKEKHPKNSMVYYYIARMMATRLGMSKNFDMMGLETAAKVDEEVLDYIKKAYEKSINILKENIDKLHELSRYLLEREIITGEKFMKILSN